MQRILISLAFLYSCAAFATENRFELAQSGNAKILVVAGEDINRSPLRIEITENFYVSRSRYIIKGHYFPSTLNHLSLEANDIFEADPIRGKIQIGRLSNVAGKFVAELCTGNFESVCDYRFNRGMYNSFFVFLKN